MAIDYARAHEYPDTIEYQLCAVIVRGGAVISVGYNKHTTNGFVEHFADQVRGLRNYCLSTHAELDAVYLARNKTDLRGCKIYVARIRRDKDMDPLGMARPCSICSNMLYRYGIKRAYYSIDSHHFGILKLKHSEHESDVIVRC